MKISIITISESKRLVALEKVIEAGKKTFVEVGTALAQIRDDRLYRSDYKTFEEYCREKLGWGKAYAYQLIGCAEVKKSPIGDSVQNQAQAKELAKVDPDKRAEVIEVATAKAESESRPLTARDIKEAAESPVETTAVEEEDVPFDVPNKDFEKRVEREFHKFMDKFSAGELPEVRRIIRPWVARN